MNFGFAYYRWEKIIFEVAPVVRWRTKYIENGYISDWDGTWTHFGCEPRERDKIDYLQIELTKENSDFVLDALRKIHAPGEERDGIISIYGYKTDIDYLPVGS